MYEAYVIEMKGSFPTTVYAACQSTIDLNWGVSKQPHDYETAQTPVYVSLNM
jgi:hypothetical protein